MCVCVSNIYLNIKKKVFRHASWAGEQLAAIWKRTLASVSPSLSFVHCVFVLFFFNHHGNIGSISLLYVRVRVCVSVVYECLSVCSRVYIEFPFH